ncbi:MAG TPA: PQQ-binding-like beta-propeller repeat protein [Ktedonobacteraceae bacterium]|nr:PQQ-binding-like beta-propeller repeat protein [Ktedonobacteraceae bacterium]
MWTSISTGSIIESSPTVAGVVVYIGSADGSLYAFDATGCGNPPCSPLWTSPPTGDAIFSSPTVAIGTVYVGSLDHKLYAFHLGTTP